MSSEFDEAMRAAGFTITSCADASILDLCSEEWIAENCAESCGACETCEDLDHYLHALGYSCAETVALVGCEADAVFASSPPGLLMPFPGLRVGMFCPQTCSEYSSEFCELTVGHPKVGCFESEGVPSKELCQCHPSCESCGYFQGKKNISHGYIPQRSDCLTCPEFRKLTFLFDEKSDGGMCMGDANCNSRKTWNKETVKGMLTSR
jgi:hypothetical protein